MAIQTRNNRDHASRRISNKLGAKIKQVNKLKSEFDVLYSSYSRLDCDCNNLIELFTSSSISSTTNNPTTV